MTYTNRFRYDRASSIRSSYAASSAPKEVIDLDVTLDAFEPLPKPSAANAYYDLGDREGREFYDGMTVANYREKLAAYALSDGPAALRARMIDTIALRSKASKIRRENYKREGGRVGSAYEYARYRSGATSDPRFYERRRRAEVPHKGTIVIHSSASMHGGEDALSLEWTGATAASIVDMLEGIGYRCVVRVVYGNAGNSKEIQLAVTVKSEDERMSEHALAYMCNGGYNRFLTFRMWLSTAAKCRPGLGSVNPYTGSLTADITIPHSVRSEYAAETFIRETMARYQTTDLDTEERHTDDRERMAESSSAWGYRDDFGR